MTARVAAVIAVLALLLCSCSGRAGAAEDSVVDDFNGPAGSSPDPALWGYDLGNPSPANKELQIYTRSPDNVRLDGKGNLVIQARKNEGGFTSARVRTRGRMEMFFGRVSARIKVPTGQGIWPAFWVLGTNIDTVGWPECGEVDIMELPNVADVYNVTLHGPAGGSDYLDDGGVRSSGPIADLSGGFHEYWMDWKPDRITVGVDGMTLADFTPASLPPGGEWVFNRPMYAILNVAVGGNWPGSPNGDTEFPATMLVDWFRYTPAA